MTREEAIENLKQLKDGGVFVNLNEALDMAIEALQGDTVATIQTGQTYGKSAYIKEFAEVVRCKDCKHRPHLENENGSDYGFNVSGDEMCPCVNNDDGWYSWMPKDNFYCGFGERKGGADAEAVQLKQTDTLIIADALRYLAQDEERHLSDRTRADALRGQILKYGASMCHSAEAVQGWIPCNKQMPDESEAVNVTWVNHLAPPYYKHIEDVPLVDSAVYYRGKWYWWDATVIDVLAEYGEDCNAEQIGKDIEILAWMPLPKPYKGGDSE